MKKAAGRRGKKANVEPDVEEEVEKVEKPSRGGRKKAPAPAAEEDVENFSPVK